MNTYSKQSDTYKLFLDHYITGNPMIRYKGEEDITIWNKLVGNELEEAKQLLMNELIRKPDSSYIKAIGIFRDKKAIPILKKIISLDSNEYIMEKLRAAKVLYDWIGYDEYVDLLKRTCVNANGSLLVLLQLSINEFTNSLSDTDTIEINNFLLYELHLPRYYARHYPYDKRNKTSI